MPDLLRGYRPVAVNTLSDISDQALEELSRWIPTNVHIPASQTSAPSLGYTTATWDPANIADGAATAVAVTLTGAKLGDFVVCSFSLAVPAGAILSAQVTAADTITVTLFNKTGVALDLASGTVKVGILR